MDNCQCIYRDQLTMICNDCGAAALHKLATHCHFGEALEEAH